MANKLVKLNAVRLNFPTVFEPKSIRGSKPKFSTQSLIEKDSANHKAMLEAIVEVAEAKWPGKGKDMARKLAKSDDICLRDGDKLAEEKEVDVYEGHMVVNASSSNRPTVVDRDKTQLTEADGQIFSGVYANVHLEVWAQDNDFGKRINAGLVGVQYVKRGEPLAGGGRVMSPDDFDDLGVENEGEEDSDDDINSLL